MQGAQAAQILLCTQNEALSKRFDSMLRRWASEQCVEIGLEVCGSLPASGPALLLLDTDTIPSGQADQRPEGLARTAIIGISGKSRQAIQAYRWHAEAFLKPQPTRRELRRAMDLCFPAWRDGLLWLDLPARRERVRMPLCQLRYAEAAGHETLLFSTTGGMVRASVPLKKLEEELPSPPFFRCQKAFLVHLSAVAEFSAGQLKLKGEDGCCIPVGRQQTAPLRQALKSWKEG